MKEKSKYGMPPPTSRAEFEHNVFLLVEDFERHKNNQSYLENRLWALGESLEHSRYLPNRRIELSTIDERMRLLSNMMDWVHIPGHTRSLSGSILRHKISLKSAILYPFIP